MRMKKRVAMAMAMATKRARVTRASDSDEGKRENVGDDNGHEGGG